MGTFREKNAGDDAIFSPMIADLKEAIPDARFIIPTRCPHFLLDRYGDKYDIEPISVTLKDVTIKLPLFIFKGLKSVYKSDVVMITQSMLFDYKLFNPKHNSLFGIFALFLYAKLLGKTIGYYNATIGPLNTWAGRAILRFMSNRTDFIILRDNWSAEVLKQLNVTKPLIYVTADEAFNATPVSKEEAIQIMTREGINPERKLVGVNVNFYIGTWVKSDINEEKFIEIISESVNRIIEELDVDIVFVITDYFDIDLTNRIRNRVKHQRNVTMVDNKKYDHPELMGILGQLDMFIGMRLHSIVMAATMNTPIIGIVYVDKVRSFMKMLKQEDKVIEFKDLDVENLVSKAKELWLQKEKVKKEVEPVIEELQQKAHSSAKILLKHLERTEGD